MSNSKTGSKKLLLVRHAKSDWDSLALDDFDRPLNEKGKKDAPVMAQRLLDKKIKIDAFVASPARRARKTASIFARAYDVGKKKIILKDELYAAPAEKFYDVVSSLDDKYDTVAVFSHNPGLTEFANELTEVNMDNVPTCGIFAVKINASHWKDFREADKVFWFVDYPKMQVG
jgi:phosphohistidine phosphatase